MNIFRSLIGKVWQDPNAAEVVKIPTGQFYLVRPGNVRSSRECIYNDAMAAIRRVPSVEHNFQLVITRVYEEGDQELLEDEEETDEERVFLISEELEFRTGEHEGEPTFLWRDLQGDVNEFYEFIAPGTNAPTRAFFETCMYRAMYERKYRKSADTVGDTDLQEFIWQPPATKSKGKSTKKRTASKGNASTVTESAADVSQDLSVASPSRNRSPFASFPVLMEVPAQLFLWDHDAGVFEEQEHETPLFAKIVQSSADAFEYWLIVSTKDGDLLAHRVSQDMNQKWSSRMQSLTWNHMNENGIQNSWCLRMAEPSDFENFTAAFIRAHWETLHQFSWQKVKADEQAYVMRARTTDDVEMTDVSEEEEEEEVAEELEEKSESEESEEEDVENEDAPPALGRGERNSQLTVGYKGDRSYVVRGNKIGVFGYTGDQQVRYHATIGNLATPKGKEFTPKKIMLHDQDTKMVLMNPSQPNSLFSMDIDYGKIVDEWKVHDDITVDHIAPDNKFAQMTPQQTLVGASHNALFRVDPRVSGNKIVDSQFKQYVSKNKFSDVATTAAGGLAVASEKGDIRLFDSIGKNAKTALPPLGDPIMGVDVTANGRWVVATTKSYLLLIDTMIGEGRYTGSLGFDRSFPANAKPIPKMLRLRGEHVAYMGHEVSFTPARFNMGEGQEENAIVTSTGQYVIMWDFNKVKRGQIDKYEIKKYEDFVVQDNFKFNDDKEIIIALQNNVLAVNKKSLKKPTRTSLAPPRSSIRSHSSIVNSPY